MLKIIYNCWRYFYMCSVMISLVPTVLSSGLHRCLVILLCLATHHWWWHCAVPHRHSIVMCIWVVVCVIVHSFFKTLFDCVNMMVQIDTCLLYKLPRFNFSVRLHFQFNQVKKRVRSSIASKSNTFVSQQLLTDNISKSMIFFVNCNGCKVLNLQAFFILNSLFSFFHVKVSFQYVFVYKLHFLNYKWKLKLINFETIF